MGSPRDVTASREPHRVMFMYWGRRGGLSRFASDLWRAASAEPSLESEMSLSRQNERFGDFATSASRILDIDTFAHPAGALLRLPAIPGLRRRLRDRLIASRTQTVVTLLSHVWTPLVASTFAELGIRTATIVHDADPHPGDRTGLAQFWYQRDLARTDRLITLSQAVTDRLTARHGVSQEKILTLFHPDFEPGGEAVACRERRPGQPIRLLFLGRIMPYKGLGLLLDALLQLRSEGVAATLGVFGAGDLAPYRERLAAVDAEIVNRWLNDAEIDAILARHDALVLSHTEASQSGVAALALGQGLPIVARRVGGLGEQVIDGETGILANGETTEDLARAIERLSVDDALYRTIRQRTIMAGSRRSMAAFVRRLALDLSVGRLELPEAAANQARG